MNLRRVNVQANGLELFVGPLEARVIDAMYDGARTIPQIHKALMVDTPFIAYTTVATTVTHLVDKQLIQRVREPGLAQYVPEYATREHFIEVAVETAIRALVLSYGATVARTIKKLASERKVA